MDTPENIYHDDSHYKTKKNHKKTAKGMCILILLSLGLCLVYSVIIKGVKEEQIASINRIKEEQYSQIENYLEILQEESFKIVNDISDDIEKDINNDIDLDQLKSDMDNNVFNEDLHDVLEKNIRDKYLNGIKNYRNGIVIATTNVILEDGSYDRSSKITRSWENDIKNSYNPELKKDAYFKLINHHTDELIVIEPVNLMDDDSQHMRVKHMDSEVLKMVFEKEGLEGLRNYQFFIPAYITENGDVFGQQDIIQGQRNDTHKIIVIQEFNLYDQILKKYPDIIDSEEIQELEIRYDNTMKWLYILGCLYIISNVILLIIVSSIYNRFIEDYGLVYEEETCTEET